MMMGVMAISVEAMPAAVYWTAISEKPTPTKGPKTVVARATERPFLSCMACNREALLVVHSLAQWLKPLVEIE